MLEEQRGIDGGVGRLERTRGARGGWGLRQESGHGLTAQREGDRTVDECVEGAS
jgi:hypothetical protein